MWLLKKDYFVAYKRGLFNATQNGESGFSTALKNLGNSLCPFGKLNLDFEDKLRYNEG